MTQSITYLSKKDYVLDTIIKNHGNPIIQKREEGFASMCHIILEQQVSIASAKACYDKLLLQLNEISPTSIFNATEQELRKCGVSRQKISYLKHLAEKVITNQIDFVSFAS